MSAEPRLDLALPLLIGAGAMLWVALAGAAVHFAVASLGRVSLHRMSREENGRRRELEGLALPSSGHWLAAWWARYLGLLGGVLLAVFGADLAGWPHPGWIGAACGAGTLLLELLLAYPLALKHPRRVLELTAPGLRVLRTLLYPLLALWVRPATRWRAGADDEADNGDEDPDAEAEAMIEVAEREGILEAEEGRMIRGIVDLGDTRVREIMTPRTDIIALEAEGTVGSALPALRSANHTRLPVYRESMDEIVGILHVRDLVLAWDEGHRGDPLTAYLRPAFFVPETLWVADLLAEMRTRTHIALVVDEYGGIAGLVTLEDLLEEIVGEIRDEHDQEEDVVVGQDDGSWLVAGAAHVKELEAAVGGKLQEDRDFDTVGGLVVARLGRVPAQGETLETQGLRIEVVEADPRRVYRVRVRRMPSGDGSAAVPESGRES